MTLRLRWLLPLLLLSCTNEPATRKTLDAAGFTDVTITGFSPYSCSEEDEYSTGFEATNPRGKRVSGVVCCGIMKNCTIRF